MNNKLDILIKCIVLLHRERLLTGDNKDDSGDSSSDIIKNILKSFKDDRRQLQGGDSVIVADLQNLIQDMSNNSEMCDKEILLQSLSVLLKDDIKLYNIIEKQINTEIENNGLKNSITSLRKNLVTYQRQTEIRNILDKASYDLKLNRIELPFQDYISNLIGNIEALNQSVKAKDPGIMGEVDLNTPESLIETADKIHEYGENKGVFKTGWNSINRMLNGGFRRGSQWVLLALNHQYKSGFTQSLFSQFATCNVPSLNDSSKKPLILLISLEDDVPVIIEFIFRYLYYTEHKEPPLLKDFTSKQMAEYITKKLSLNGFHSKIIRVNPSEWDIKKLFNKVIELESQNYEIQALFVDYLSKLPTTYCDNTGPQGTAVRDMFNRVRNFCSARDILFITPHQLSTDALTLFRNGVTGFDFLDEMIGSKNYYSESKQIAQVVDGEIFLTKAKVGKKDWRLYVGKGKHRSPTITPDEDKQTMFKFPIGAPIPEDTNSELEEDDEYNEETNSDYDF